MEEITQLKRSFKYFKDNKAAILAILYICAIAKDYIWYSMFGVNIFGFISIQDTLISFLDHNIIFLLIILTYLGVEFLFTEAKQTKILHFVKGLVFVLISLTCFFISKKPVSYLTLLIILSIFYHFLAKKQFEKLSRFLILFLLLYSIFEPLIQGFLIRREPPETRKKPGYYLWDKSNGDYYSFQYGDSTIDTKLHQYYLVGNTTDYFFIFNYKEDKCMVIPKSECKNLKAEFRIIPSQQ